MTFNDAVIRKAKLPQAFTYKGNKMKIYIVPLLQADFENFLNHLNGHRITNKTAQLFSTNDQFTIKGVTIINQAITCLNFQELINVI